MSDQASTVMKRMKIITEDLLFQCQFVFGMTDEHLGLSNAESQDTPGLKKNNSQKEYQQAHSREYHDISQKKLLDKI